MEQIEELRNYIKTVLRKIKRDQQESLKAEIKEDHNLRKLVRKMLREVKETSPHELTGINVLEKLLGNIMPVIETGYKSLTTDKAQRESYAAHVLSAVKNLLAIPSMYFNIDKSNKLDANTTQPQEKPETAQMKASVGVESSPETEQPEEELQEAEEEEKEDIDPKDIPDEEKFIDINKDKKQEEPQQQEKDPMSAFQDIDGEDHTGRSFALETFKKVQKQILESYGILSNDKDREVFEEYLITNIRMYLDGFEKELSDNPPKPTTPSYEAEKQKQNANLETAQAPQPAAGTPPATEQPA